MPFSDYPKVKPPLGTFTLKEPYPVWFLDPCGVIHAANLLAFWLWEAILPGRSFQPDTLLNESVFNIITINLKRIPIKQNTNFYAIKSAAAKRMDAGLHSPLYSSFISAMEADLQLKKIFDNANPNPDREWEYLLRITAPRESGTAKLLEFVVTIYRLTVDSGLLVVYIPTPNTLPFIEEQYSQLISRYGDQAYVQPGNIELENVQVTSVSNLISPRRAYYPALRHDSLWNITENNESHQWLFGESVVGKNFFDIVFSSPFRKWQGPLYDTSALNAVKYFDTLTASLKNEDHELHDEYVSVMKHLLQLPDFPRLLNISRKIPIHVNIPKNMEIPFYTCRVLLPWPISDDTTLQFRSMSQLVHEELPSHKSIMQDMWDVILVPENYETEAALVLLNLSRTVASATNATNLVLDQFIWGLAVMQTVEEGILRKKVDIYWQPRSAFNRFLKRLLSKFSNRSANDIEAVVARLRVILETMDKVGVLDKKRILDMLVALVSTDRRLNGLKEHLISELRIHKEIEEHLGEAEILRGSHEMEWIMPRETTNKDNPEDFNEGELKTIVFDDQEEYVRFTDHVFEEYRGEGLIFTDVPIVTSVCVTPQLFEQTSNQFDMHLVTDEDIEQAHAERRGR